MLGRKLKLSASLYERLKQVAELRGYSSPEEFAVHVLEQATAEAEKSLTAAEVKQRLKGLGYLE
jgi:hypothetical protein